jgi:uncharacterized membrane protein
MLARLARPVLIALVLLIAAYLALVFLWVYSSGDRAGWVMKFSRKGWICKTWEGELSMAAVPGLMPEKFAFTVHDDAVAAQVNASMGQAVRLHYEQHRGLPGTCFGETGYWVDGQSVVSNQPSAVSPAGPLPPAMPPDAKKN